MLSFLAVTLRKTAEDAKHGKNKSFLEEALLGV